MNYRVITDFALRGKKVLIRVDMNVPVHNGKIIDNTRIKASLPSIEYALQAGAMVIIMTHLGRPAEGNYQEEYSVAPVAGEVSRLLTRPVPVVRNWQSEKLPFVPGAVFMLENVRFNKGEKANSEDLSRAYAGLADIFINDAFGTAHRAQASTCGVAKFIPQVGCGLLLDAELKNLQRATAAPQRPILAIVGGSKISTKLAVLAKLAGRVDQLIVGGGIANTFLAATGVNVGASLTEPSLLASARDIITAVTTRGGILPLPVDVYVAKKIAADAPATLKNIRALSSDDLILDFGPETMKNLTALIAAAKTIIWNGPIGVFELAQFARGTRELAAAIAASPAFSIAGGGETLAAISQLQIGDKINYVSTGGGAFLEFLEGKTLPAVAVLLQ